ncbi:ATPase [Plebeiibacterium marinum]|uniref:ATPase n=1 Tax=Plebeiibacterium marinum TaxID=2992111 RepID=A0AAE3SLX8_9BACT|nr:ATPase [Plebeiobacterium marinum]MCW3808073.1 ATPase [Plebeiobacterium marinum]
MILIADSGSSKTEWRIISNKTDNEGTCITQGINPFYQDQKDISKSLEREYLINKNIKEIYFYGAGCTNDEKKNVVRNSLSNFFNTKKININTDLLGAARSLCGNKTGIACILGTGSNSCLYNGTEITQNTPPLGFIIGDEGSGAALGKKTIGNILKNQLPKNIIDLFFKEYQTTQSEILDNVYKRPFPNRYLAKFSCFLSKYIEFEELEAIVILSFKEFIEKNLLQYKDVEKMKIHFTGSIAYHFKPQLIKALNAFNLNPGQIQKSPVEGLAKFHSQPNQFHV